MPLRDVLSTSVIAETDLAVSSGVDCGDDGGDGGDCCECR
jgi:hypothetical protein